MKRTEQWFEKLQHGENPPGIKMLDWMKEHPKTVLGTFCGVIIGLLLYALNLTE